ncbi:MAG: hypothetical protein IJ877_03840 [Candidatus Gastranaerophilales bacterium]|nr:hypothetical protein [Candidatus Gastranaerophilales bacterium]
MINELFKTKFPFAYNYFSVLMETENIKKFPQSIIFEGADTKSSYYFALELARNLNCQKEKTKNCDCTDCKWIKSYTHPAVNNVSQIHFKPDGDETKTQISVKQAREIEKSLTLSSDYHRFFIFFSSSVCEIANNEYGYSAIDFSIEPLDIQVFNLSVANALLKSVEEPPENTTFVFLAKSKEDILSTIVSRSQVFKLSCGVNVLDYSDISVYLNEYFSLDYVKALNLADTFLNHIKTNNLNIENILNKLIAYLSDILKQNSSNGQIADKINRDIKFIANAIRHTYANMQDKIVLEALFLRIARGY